MLWGNRMSSCLHTEENVSSFALQSSQHSVAHIRASDDKNTFKCCWTEGIVLHILEFLWFSMNAPLWAMLEEVLQAPTGSGDADGFCSQSESKEGGGKGRQRKKGTFFFNGYVGCCSLQQTLSFCGSGCEMPRRNALLFGYNMNFPAASLPFPCEQSVMFY